MSCCDHSEFLRYYESVYIAFYLVPPPPKKKNWAMKQRFHILLQPNILTFLRLH